MNKLLEMFQKHLVDFNKDGMMSNLPPGTACNPTRILEAHISKESVEIIASRKDMTYIDSFVINPSLIQSAWPEFNMTTDEICKDLDEVNSVLAACWSDSDDFLESVWDGESAGHELISIGLSKDTAKVTALEWEGSTVYQIIPLSKVLEYANKHIDI